MMAVKAENISKVYRFYKKPVHRLLEALMRRPMHTAFSALEGISFSVPAGSTLGIIGENGAGKSTLLKILAKTLTSSSGTMEINGRVSALLELGAGFHQEFTGRQNIYLNASLMGLSEKEIKDREKDIIGFAELGEFIDRPIKTYSSGMVVRLGFSIATSVDPDILVVDEALSVGDQRFQEKCIKRMQGFRKKNKTIVVCSHSMYLINALCGTCMWIDHGRIKMTGSSDEVISEYLAYLETNHISRDGHVSGPGTAEVIVEGVDILGKDGRRLKSADQFSTLNIRVRTRCLREDFMGHLAVVLEDKSENSLFGAYSRDFRPQGIRFSGQQSLSLILPSLCLQKGSFNVRAIITDEHGMRLIDQKPTRPIPVISSHPEYGLMWMEHEWKI